MTNKRKIAILKKIIKNFSAIIPKLRKDKYAYRKLKRLGICNHGAFIVMDEHELNSFTDYAHGDGFGYKVTELFQKEFMVKMPKAKGNVFKWAFTVKGYQSRIKACEKAIERLSK